MKRFKRFLLAICKIVYVLAFINVIIVAGFMATNGIWYQSFDFYMLLNLTISAVIWVLGSFFLKK